MLTVRSLFTNPGSCELTAPAVQLADKRLGHSKMLRHAFFSSLDWAALLTTTPPYVPDVSSAEDDSHFDIISDERRKVRALRKTALDLKEKEETIENLRLKLAEELSSKKKHKHVRDQEKLEIVNVITSRDKELREEKKKVQTKKLELKDKIDEINECEQIRLQNENLKQSIVQVSNENKDLLQRNENYEQRIIICTTDTETLKEKVALLEEEKSELLSQVKQEEQLATLQEQLQLKSSHSFELQQELDQLKSELQSKLSEADVMQSEFDSIKADYYDWQVWGASKMQEFAELTESLS